MNGDETVPGDAPLGSLSLKVKLGTWVLYSLLAITMIKRCVQSETRKKSAFGYHSRRIESILAAREWQQKPEAANSHFIGTREAEREREGEGEQEVGPGFKTS